ncbi:flagellar biosynthesis protein FlhF [Cohnella boryungensis]|uniref:Flagellar biosynthesis protein FlhF n=1 Tax=Cohnella boryungensis TaxID=768479 RepID=A0ABV8SJC5_9BACL
MKVKRYIVDDLPDAVQQIRAELGSDAVILNTKEIRVGGFLGMFSKKRMEVIAAVDEASRKPPPRASMPVRPTETKPPVLLMEEPDAPAVSVSSSTVRARYTQAPFADSGRSSAAPTPTVAAAVQAAEPEEPGSGGLARGAVETAIPQEEERLDRFRTSLAERLKTDALAAGMAKPAGLVDSSSSTDETADLLKELRSLKDMMAKMTKQQTYRSMPEAILMWSKRLAEQGVEPAYVEQFAEAVNGRLGDEQADGGKVYEEARDVLLTWLRGAKGNGISEATRLVNFVGPTGVGKTTTIAKLAADQAFSERRNVGFITADTYRIAAVDQLRTYADILNVPLEVVFSPGELTRAYKKMDDRDLLFMDTAGRNYRNELFVSEVNSLLSPGEQSETILVLSMTSKYGDMKAVAAQFAKYGVRQLLLTKFDETDSFGAVVNLVKQFDFQISYVTCGQTVPDDLRPFDPEELVGRLLGEPADA